MQSIKFKRSEDAEQIFVMQWAKVQKYEDGKVADYLHHSPNGGSRHKLEATKFKRMGVMAGFPDLFLFVAKENYHGLFIELKAEGGRVQPSQKQAMERLTKQGYLCKVCFGANQAIEQIQEYLKL